MTHAEKGFDTDVNELMAVGKFDLPDLANIYGTLNNEVAGTNQYDTRAFTDIEASGQGLSVSAVGAPWTELRARLQNFLGDGSNRFQAAGEAIVQIAKKYGDSDASTKADMESEWQPGMMPGWLGDNTNDHNPVPLPPKPPPVVTGPDAPTVGPNTSGP